MVGASCAFIDFLLPGFLGSLECYLGCWLKAGLVKRSGDLHHTVSGVWMWGRVRGLADELVRLLWSRDV